MRLPTPENTARQRRSGIREYIKISDRWQDLYQRIGKTEVKQGISYIRNLVKEVYPALPGQAEPAAVHRPPQVVSGSSPDPLFTLPDQVAATYSVGCSFKYIEMADGRTRGSQGVYPSSTAKKRIAYYL